MKRKGLVVIVTFALMLSIACSASAAYKISYFYVGHRVYEDGRNLNRINIEFRDESGNYPQEDQLKSLVLINPKGKQVPIANLKFYNDGMLSGYYDANNGIWIYGELGPDVGYGGVIEQALIQGIYSLKANFAGAKSSMTYAFNGLEKLPIIKSSSIKTKDFQGNLICEWAVPYSLSKTNPGLTTSVRAMIDIYQQDAYRGCLWVRIPTHMGRLFVPRSVLDIIESTGDKFVVGIQLRTNDNNNRTYSAGKEITLPPPQ